MAKSYRRFWRVILGYIPLGMAIERYDIVEKVLYNGLMEYLKPIWPQIKQVIRYLGWVLPDKLYM